MAPLGGENEVEARAHGVLQEFGVVLLALSIAALLPQGLTGIVSAAHHEPPSFQPQGILTIVGGVAGLITWVLFRRSRSARACGDLAQALILRRSFLTVVIGSLATVILGIGAAVLFSPRAKVLSPEDSLRFKELLLSAMNNPDGPTDGEWEEMQVIVKQSGLAKAQVDEIRRFMRAAILDYQRLFWEDARQSLKAGVPCCSNQRKAFEDTWVAKGAISQERVTMNSQYMERIARRIPISRQNGEELLVTDTFADEVLFGLDQSSRRVDNLFSPFRPSIMDSLVDSLSNDKK